MRIGLVSFEMTASGGEQRQLLRLALELRELGHSVTLYAARFNPDSCYPSLSHRVGIQSLEQLSGEEIEHRASVPGKVASAIRRYFLESRRLARRIEPLDVLNAHSRPGHRAAVFAKGTTGSPVVWTCNDVVSWEKPGYRARMPTLVQALAGRVMLPLERSIVGKVDRIAVLDNETREIIERVYGRPARVVRTGLDTQSLAFRPVGRKRVRKCWGIPDRAFVVMWLGLLEPFRRLEDLLEGVRLRRQEGADLRVLIVGRHDTAPRYAGDLRRFVKHRSLEGVVEFVTHSVPEDELADYYSACDTFVFPNDQQAWGLAPLEALACERPVVVSRGSGVHEVLTDGETALLVPRREPAAIAQALRTLMEIPALAGRIAEQGRAFVKGEFSWSGYAARMVELFEETIEAAHRMKQPLRKPGEWPERRSMRAVAGGEGRGQPR